MFYSFTCVYAVYRVIKYSESIVEKDHFLCLHYFLCIGPEHKLLAVPMQRWNYLFILDFCREYKQSDQYFGYDRFRLFFRCEHMIQCHLMILSKHIDEGYFIFHLDIALFRMVCASSMYYVLIHSRFRFE